MSSGTNPRLMNNALAPNGRKRRLSVLRYKCPDPTLSSPVQPVKYQRLSSEAHTNSMAHLPGSNNHKMAAPGSGVGAGRSAKVGFNNVAKKSSQGKKLVIKNRKVKPDLPDNYESDTCSKLSEVIVAVQLQRSISYSLEELYQAVENMCSHKMAASLYSNLRSECDRHVCSLIPKFDRPEMGDGEFLLLVSKQWNDHCNQMIMIRSIFLYLDRTYAVPSSSVLSIWDMGLELFGCHIIAPTRVQGRVVRGILSLITKERCGETVDRLLLKNLLTMLVDLRMYSEAFETDFLLETELIYRSESLRMMRDTEFTLPDYLAHVDRRLQQETELLNNYLHKSTRKPLILCVEKQLIGEHLQEILDKGYESLLEAVRVTELSLLYGFFSRFKDGLPLMTKAFSDYIKKSGIAIVSDVEREKTMVQELLELKAKVDGIIENAFKGSPLFVGVVREGFEAVVNRRQNKPAELIAKYVDVQLKSGNKEWTDEQMERLMDKVMVLFRFINGKDVFEAFYKKDLAKRLLLGKSASFDAEKSMLLKLKQECGANFTSKLEGMFKDMELSREMMVSFKETSRHRVSDNVDLNVHVLTMGHWPTYTPMEVQLPTELIQYQEAFKSFYLNKHNGRRLQWQPSLGHCVLKAAFPHGEKELQVSLFQALVLLLFNTADKLPFTHIKENTQIDDGELRRTLQSLSLGKQGTGGRVLIKTPKGKEVRDEDEFVYNREFRHRMCRIKINQVQLKETQEENTATNERVFQDRQYQVDAAIVRIMKMRRTLPHNLLVSECISQLRFHVRPSDLKKRIESLIDRDYIRRSKDNSSIYDYIA